MSKQRPSSLAPEPPARPKGSVPARFNAAYWRRRLFKNTFTRDGQRTAVKGWSVKIQHQGRRRTFSLTAANREDAAREAWQIYRTIVSPVREAIARPLDGVNPKASVASGTTAKPPVPAKVLDWQPRLLHRKYLESARAEVTREFSVRIEHAGTSHYFRLGTNNEKRAASQAALIYRSITTQGWDAMTERFCCELTIALRWLDNPVAWTYFTLHTQPSSRRALPPTTPAGQAKHLNVAVVDSDAGIRHALARGIDFQNGFCCIATFADFDEALRWITRWQISLLLVNHGLASTPGRDCLEELKTVAPSASGLLYSIYEDSDQLFTSVPGGVAGYLLKRTPPNKILEPVADNSDGKNISSEELAIRVQQYFRRILTHLPESGSLRQMSKLTHRENEVLALLSKGFLDKEIADSLRISIWTVHGHVKNIFEKLNVHTRTEAVVKFLQK